MWAFCIHDKEKDKLFLSRDQLGIKQLYYHQQGKRFAFSSEIKALRDVTSFSVHEDYFYEFLTYNVGSGSRGSLVKEAEQLPAGHNMIYDLKTKRIKKKRYYTPLTKRTDFKDELFKSVELRLVADVPVGSCLSGGLDSSSIVCIMHALGKKHVDCFSLVFPGKKIDEERYQRQIIKKTGYKHHKTTFAEKDIIKDIDDFITTFEEPLQTLSVYGQYKVMELARKNNIKVIMDGQGADEILFGYEWYFAYQFKRLLRKGLLFAALKELQAYHKRHNNLLPLKNLATLYLPVLVNQWLWKRMNKHINPFAKVKKTRKQLLWRAQDPHEAGIVAVQELVLPNLLRYEDKNSMRWSVESRVPFCDHEVVASALGHSPEKIIHEGQTKLPLRVAMKGILPPSINNRQDKIGFSTPDDDLLRTKEGRKWAESIIKSDTFRKRKYWDVDVVEQLFFEQGRGKSHARKLIPVLTSELWLRSFIDP